MKADIRAEIVKRPPIGVVGLGIMGSAMAGNLMKAGFQVLGYDVLASRRRQHRQAGGLVAASVAGVARRADIVVCSLPSSAALLRVAGEVAAAPGRQPVVIETSTLPIAAKEQARDQLAARGSILLDCPLSGTGAQAKTRDLVVFASGDRAACRRVASTSSRSSKRGRASPMRGPSLPPARG